MTKLETYFQNAQDLDTYISEMKENQEGLLKIYESFTVPEDDSRIEQVKQKSYRKVLAISEDWCGDAMMNIAILKHISELLDLEVRVFHRDQDTDLIDQYLTNGKARAIPIFVFLNDQYEQENVWAHAQKLHKSSLKKLEKNYFQIKMMKIMMKPYNKLMLSSATASKQIQIFGKKFTTLS